MKKGIEKLALTQGQYAVLGIVLIAACVLLCAASFWVADQSWLLGAVIACVAVEAGLFGIVFRKVSAELSECSDPAIAALHVKSEKSRNNTFCVWLVIALSIVICAFFTVVFLKYSNVENADFQEASTTQSQTVYNVQTASQITNSSDAQANDAPEDLTASDSDAVIVFATQTGKRYHFSQNCAGKNCFSITLQEALDHLLTPCMLCGEGV